MKKIALISIILLTAVLSSCSLFPKSKTIYFETNGGTDVSPATLESGESLTLSIYKTTKENYIFAGWYIDDNFSQRISFLAYEDANDGQTLYAKWNHEHDWGLPTISKKATCTENGLETYTCSICGETKTEELISTGHEWDEGVITTAATYTDDGVKTYTCLKCNATKTENYIPIRVTDVVLNKSNIKLLENDTYTLIATIYPSNAEFKTMTWKSSDDSIITVDENGKITAIANGKATITVVTDDQNQTASCEITITTIDQIVDITSNCSNVIMNGYAYGCGVQTTFCNYSLHDVNLDKVEVYDGTTLVLYGTDQSVLGSCPAETYKSVQRTQAYAHLIPTTFTINWYFTYNGVSYTITKDIIHQ